MVTLILGIATEGIDLLKLLVLGRNYLGLLVDLGTAKLLKHFPCSLVLPGPVEKVALILRNIKRFLNYFEVFDMLADVLWEHLQQSTQKNEMTFVIFTENLPWKKNAAFGSHLTFCR